MREYVLDDPTLDAVRIARTRYGRGCAARTLEILQECAGRRLSSAMRLRRYHDHLLFLTAYPNDARVLALAEAELRRVARVAAELERRARPGALRKSGVANTAFVTTFSFDLMRWLSRRFPRDADVAWEDGSGGEALDDLLPLCVTSPEIDGLLGAGPAAEAWVQLAKGPTGRSDLRFLVDLLGGLDCTPALLDTIVERLELPVRWRLRNPIASLTHARFPERPAFFQRTRLVRRVSLRRQLAAPLAPVSPLPAKTARRVIDVARVALALRDRETDPVTYANPDEVYLFRLERGVDVAVLGMLPERRLPIESFFGYVAARNRVPIAYGGGWAFFDRVEIGVNVFEQFRGGESSHVFAQILRVYRCLFRPRIIDVDPYQVGVGNDEAIRSGAFWFYYRLGFRPLGRAERDLARAEWHKLRRDRSHRSPAAVLRRVAASPLRFHLDGGASREEAPALGSIGRAVTRIVAERWRGDPVVAERSAWRSLSKLLPVTGTRAWSQAERRAAKRLGVLAAALPALESWPEGDRASLAAILRAKGSVREADYVARLQRHDRARDALRRLVAG